MKNKQIHLITPFLRHYLKKILIEAYRPMEIIWHPIIFQDEETEFYPKVVGAIESPWIFPYIIPMNREDCKAVMPQYFMRNWWIKNNEIIDDDYYVTVDDDDMYEAGVFDAIKQMDDDIVIISMKRGHHIPLDAIPIRQYPINTLIAHPDNVQRGEISSQQSFVKGKIFKAHLFDDSSQFGDGDMAVHHKKDGEQIHYEPNLFAMFNYYEPGRWNKPEISFGVLVNDMMRLNMILRNSALDPSIPCHTIKMPESATKGLNKLLDIIETSGAAIAVLTHQDMFYRQGWIEQVKEQLMKLPDSWTVAGIIGKNMAGEYAGKFHDMRTPLLFGKESDVFPIPASCFDESCIIVNMKKKFRFDEGLDGFDLYGTLCVLQTWEMGGTAWIINAFAEHYCTRNFSWYPDKIFEESFMFLHRRFPNAVRIDTTVIGIIREGDPPRWDKVTETLSEKIEVHNTALIMDAIND